jgi:hypothetical protein
MAPPEPTDPLADLRARVRATQEAAERLTGGGAGRVPPQGWATPPRTERDEARDEIAALAALLQALRDLVPPELQQQVTDLLRQVLLLLRAIIDWWVDRLEPGRPAARGEETQVEDIPIG